MPKSTPIGSISEMPAILTPKSKKLRFSKWRIGLLSLLVIFLSSCYHSNDYLGYEKPDALFLKLDGATLDFSQNMVRTDNNGNYFAQEPEGQFFNSSGEGGTIVFNVDSPDEFAKSYLTFVNGNEETFSSLIGDASLAIVVEKFERDTFDCDHVCLDNITVTFSGTLYSEAGDSLKITEGLLFFDNQ